MNIRNGVSISSEFFDAFKDIVDIIAVVHLVATVLSKSFVPYLLKSFSYVTLAVI